MSMVEIKKMDSFVAHRADTGSRSKATRRPSHLWPEGRNRLKMQTGVASSVRNITLRVRDTFSGVELSLNSVLRAGGR